MCWIVVTEDEWRDINPSVRSVVTFPVTLKHNVALRRRDEYTAKEQKHKHGKHSFTVVVPDFFSKESLKPSSEPLQHRFHVRDVNSLDKSVPGLEAETHSRWGHSDVCKAKEHRDLFEESERNERDRSSDRRTSAYTQNNKGWR